MIPQKRPVPTREQSLEALNRLMRTELAAAETYREALSMCEAPTLARDLQTCEVSHDQRATHLAEQITLGGGTPMSGSGTLGAFARLVEERGALPQQKDLLKALEEGEDQALNDYRAAMDNLETGAASMVRRDLLPQQIHTHDIMSALCHRM
jgi:bacterioferritin (cytochrome b1)